MYFQTHDLCLLLSTLKGLVRHWISVSTLQDLDKYLKQTNTVSLFIVGSIPQVPASTRQKLHTREEKLRVIQTFISRSRAPWTSRSLTLSKALVACIKNITQNMSASSQQDFIVPADLECVKCFLRIKYTGEPQLEVV